MKPRGVNIASDMKLSQFDLISTPTGNETTHKGKGQPALSTSSSALIVISFWIHARKFGDMSKTLDGSKIFFYLRLQESIVWQDNGLVLMHHWCQHI